MPARTALLDVELVEDRLRLRIARAVRLPLHAQPLVDLVEAVVRIEDAAHDELRRDRAVPAVLLQPERDVVSTHAAITVELRPVSERDRAAGIAAVALYAETEVLAVAPRRQLAELAARRQQRHVRIAEPERSEPAQLLAEVEREPRAAGQHGVDDRRRHEVVGHEQPFRLRSERVGERLHELRHDRQAGGGAVPAESLEELRAAAQRAVQVERRNRPARALPRTLAAREQDDGTVVALDEPRRHDADHALVPVVAPDDVRLAPPFRFRPLLDLCDRRAQDLLLDALAVAV